MSKSTEPKFDSEKEYPAAELSRREFVAVAAAAATAGFVRQPSQARSAIVQTDLSTLPAYGNGTIAAGVPSGPPRVGVGGGPARRPPGGVGGAPAPPHFFPRPQIIVSPFGGPAGFPLRPRDGPPPPAPPPPRGQPRRGASEPPPAAKVLPELP